MTLCHTITTIESWVESLPFWHILMVSSSTLVMWSIYVYIRSVTVTLFNSTPYCRIGLKPQNSPPLISTRLLNHQLSRLQSYSITRCLNDFCCCPPMKARINEVNSCLFNYKMPPWITCVLVFYPASLTSWAQFVT